MPTRDEWNKIIKGRGGRTGEPDTHGMTLYGDGKEHVEGSWFDKERGDAQKKKPIRDLTAREMRKDGWEVKTETNSLGWFLSARK
jgi:hypothetical protein